MTDPNKNLGGYVNIDYELNDKNSFALTFNSRANKSNESTVNLFSTVKNLKTNDTAYSWTRNKEDSHSYNNSVNLNYQLKLDSLGSKLNLNVAGLRYKRVQRSENFSYLSDVHQTELNPIIKIDQQQPQIINNFSATADYVLKFNKEFGIAVGGNLIKQKRIMILNIKLLIFVLHYQNLHPNLFYMMKISMVLISPLKGKYHQSCPRKSVPDMKQLKVKENLIT